MIERNEIAELRKVKQPLYSKPEVICYSVEYRMEGDNDWFDLLDDPPEWLCDFLIENLLQKTEAKKEEDFDKAVNDFLEKEYPDKVNKGKINCLYWNSDCHVREVKGVKISIRFLDPENHGDKPSLMWSYNVYY